MHKNLVGIQESAVNSMKEILEVLEVENRKPVIMVAMMIAEKPLSKSEITERTGIEGDELEKGIEKLLEKEIMTVYDESDEEARYEINPDIEKVIARKIRAKMEKVLDIMQVHIDNTRELLDSGKPDFDEFDFLMSKFIRVRMHKAWMIHHLLSKKRLLLNFLETGEVDKEEIKKISID